MDRMMQDSKIQGWEGGSKSRAQGGTFSLHAGGGMWNPNSLVVRSEKLLRTCMIIEKVFEKPKKIRKN